MRSYFEILDPDFGYLQGVYALSWYAAEVLIRNMPNEKEEQR